MKNRVIYNLLYLSILLLSCERKETKYILFPEKPNLDLQDVKIEDILAHENNLHSNERVTDTFFNIGTIHYKNIKSLTHKAFIKNDSKLLLQTDYYYDKKNGSLKVVTYEWATEFISNINSTVIENTEAASYPILKKKYDDIIKRITSTLNKSPKFDGPITRWETSKVKVSVAISSGSYKNPIIYLMITSKQNGL